MISALIRLNFALENENRQPEEIKDETTRIIMEGLAATGKLEKVTWEVLEVTRRWR